MTQNQISSEGVRLSPEQLKARRQRNIAIAWSIALLAVIFWAVTIVRLGSTVFQRAM